MLKRELRLKFLDQMRVLAPAERRARSETITDRLFGEVDFVSARTIHIFLSIEANNEFDTSLSIDRLKSEFPGIVICVPRVRGNELETLAFDRGTQLKLSNWNVPEPIGDSFVDPQQIDLVIVPLLAFDLRGYRVGYGKGFYDRFLRTCRPDCLKIGVSFFPPVENIADINENDVRLDLCLTPFGSYEFN